MKQVYSYLLLFLLPVLAGAKGKWYTYGETAFLKEIDYYRSYVLMADAGFEYIGNPLKSFGCELSLYQYIDKGFSSTGIGIRPTTKYYIWRAKNYRIIAEVKGGIIYMTPQYPEGGSQFNFTLNVSTGADVKIGDRYRAFAALRYAHMSNWNLYGVLSNPTWDGVGFAVGIIYGP